LRLLNAENAVTDKDMPEVGLKKGDLGAVGQPCRSDRRLPLSSASDRTAGNVLPWGLDHR